VEAAGRTLAGYTVEVVAGRITPAEAMAGRITPVLFLANNIGLALAIPLAIGAHALVYRQRPGWLASIQGRFRWRVLARFVAVCLPIFLAWLAVELFVFGGIDELHPRSETWFMIGVILLTTPLQSAGEEYAFRGLLSRSLGSCFGARRVGLVVSVGVSAGVFALAHGAGDPWLNLFYVAFGGIASWLTLRTGGLEAAIALHAVNNLVAMSFLPFTGLEGLFERDAGTGSPLVLVMLAVLVGAAAAILWQARRLALPQAAAPGAPTDGGLAANV
jgi:membrane protease YdiL (CAAX protease family)